MDKLDLMEGEKIVLLEELEELRNVEMENQELGVVAGYEKQIKQRSDGQLLCIAVWRAAEELRKDNERILKRLEAKKREGGKYLHTDGQHMSQKA